MHTVTFVYDNGAENSTIQVEEGKTVEKPADPTKGGYDFDGWYIDDFKWGFEHIVVMKNITLTAKWSAIPVTTYYTVTFHADNGTDNETAQVVSGEKIVCPETAPTKQGYNFEGWYLGEYRWNFDYNAVTENLELKAKWSAIPYNVTFIYDNGTENRVISCRYGDKITAPQVPGKVNHIFDGWFIGETEWNFDAKIFGDITLLAHWTEVDPTKYTVTFHADNGTDNETAQVVSGEKIVCPETAPTKQGYIFEGWYLGEYRWNFDYNAVTENLELKAKWSAIPYNVTFIYDNGTENRVVTYRYGEKIIEPQDPVKTGYTFEGWFNGGTVWNFDALLSGEVSLRAKWKAVAYSVAYELNGGVNSVDNAEEYTVERNVVFKNPTREGFDFIGWYKDGAFSIAVSNTNGLAENLTVYARWMKSGRIFYDLDGGTNDDKNPFVFSNEDEVLLLSPTKDGYDFGGWYTDDEFTNQITTIPKGTLTDIVLWAKWNQIYNITDSTLNGLTEYGKTRSEFKIPNGIEAIAAEAFYGCKNIVKMTISSTVLNIGNSAFEQCAELTELNFEEGNKLDSIGENAFELCKKLQSFIIPDTVKTIGLRAFHSCYALQAITIPSSVETMGDYTFAKCGALASVTFKKGCLLTTIGNATFYDCTGLTEIVIPSSVTSFGNNVLRGCSSLEKLTVPFIGSTLIPGENTHFGFLFGAVDYDNHADFVPESLKELTVTGGTRIDAHAFYFCANLVSVMLPSSVRNIYEYAFYHCEKLGSVTIGGNSELIQINNYAFEGCKNLTSFVVPASVTTIGENSFEDCRSIGSFTFEVKSQLTTIRDFAFKNCSALVSFVFPSSLEHMGKQIFINCPSLSTIEFEKNSQLHFLMEDAFKECGNLTSVSFGENSLLYSIGERAFKGCGNLVSVSFGDNSQLATIGFESFKDCVSLKSIVIPKSVFHIDTMAFDGCSGLESISVEIGNTTFDSRKKCNAIIETAENCLIIGCKNTFVPNTVEEIGGMAFYGNTALTTIVFETGSALKKIGQSAFEGCTALESVVIPTAVTQIGYAAFCNCSSLASVAFDSGSKLVHLGDFAFYGCAMSSITIHTDVEYIGLEAFYGCFELKTVYNYSDFIFVAGSSECGGIALYAETVINYKES